jgi:predicted Co/Zn/Cd cation transporter (cation efflux family)
MVSTARVMQLRSDLEARLLRTSVGATILIAALGVGLGLLANSNAIIFDGFFSGIDAAITWLTLVVARLIPRAGSRRFQFGFWHLEPLVIGLKASALIAVSAYAFVASVTAILQGGYVPAFGLAAVYAALVASICFAVWAWMRGHAERIDSGLVRLDVKAWLMSGLITSVLLVAFAAALLMKGTSAEWLVPYVDAAVLAALSLVLLPLPLREAREAFLEVFEVVPEGLDRDIRTAVSAVLEAEDFATFETYAQKSGRALFVEVDVLTDPEFARPMHEVDALRARIAAAVADATGVEPPDLWLTILFTADREQL